MVSYLCSTLSGDVKQMSLVLTVDQVSLRSSVRKQQVSRGVVTITEFQMTLGDAEVHRCNGLTQRDAFRFERVRVSETDEEGSKTMSVQRQLHHRIDLLVGREVQDHRPRERRVTNIGQSTGCEVEPAFRVDQSRPGDLIQHKKAVGTNLFASLTCEVPVVEDGHVLTHPLIGFHHRERPNKGACHLVDVL